MIEFAEHCPLCDEPAHQTQLDPEVLRFVCVGEHRFVVLATVLEEWQRLNAAHDPDWLVARRELAAFCLELPNQFFGFDWPIAARWWTRVQEAMPLKVFVRPTTGGWVISWQGESVAYSAILAEAIAHAWNIADTQGTIVRVIESVDQGWYTPRRP